ncbi:MAG TPA: glycoside hydrolase family 3 N-terminal domain-containing protein [Verrucomicrobiae bacterium]|nr:glycoside hydrolase family 3 N-terminal domain-containing protein [Verrucomicrobiae bacterium]
MKNLLSTATALFLLVQNATASTIDHEVDELLGKLSLEEKIGQMVQLDLLVVTRAGSNPIQLDPAKLREAVVTHKIGSFINNGLGRALSLAEWTYVHKTIQDMIRAETPNKVPLLYGIDSIHGATFVKDGTLFPQSIGMAATRNPELMRLSSEVSARETRAAGLRWTFAPVLDVGRQPLWSRLPETFGEDPLLASVFGVAAVKGFQGSDLSAPTSVAACMKHYVGYSFPFNGKDRSPALIPDPYLREYFLPPFREAIKAGARTIMVNSGEVNGVPVHGSKYYLTDVLRGELGFDGVVVSDWEDVIRLHKWHRIAETPADAVRIAVEAGLDISMVPLDYSFAKLLKQLVMDGRVNQERIDKSVRRILRLKVELGLLRNPYVEAEAAANFGQPEHQQLALQAAEESLTLLKNERTTLPLKKSARVLVAGPAANSISALHGCWSFTWQGLDESKYPASARSILEAIREKVGAGNVTYHQGVTFAGGAVDLESAERAAANADAVILCLGEDAYAETPGDISSLDLPAGQQELARRLQAAGKPVVLVLVQGRCRVIREIEPGAASILLAYWPGSQGARAIANVIFGDAVPSGKLPFTYPRYENHLLTYDRNHTASINEFEPPDHTPAKEFKPQWEFGTGLSYTTFEVRNLRLGAPVLRGAETLTVEVEVVNSGKRAAPETVELYTRDLFASTTPPSKRLRAFQKLSLNPGETKIATFALTASDLAFVDAQSRIVTEPGDFEVLVGGLKASFRYEP